MNPQQFQNMAGMGRAMPNNMQQMAMQMGGQMAPQMGAQMGGQMGGQMRGQMPGGMPQRAGGQMTLNHPSVQQHIFDFLNSQGPYTGWQANVSVRERAGQVKLLVDSLRLVQPPVDLHRAIEVALQFERNCFTQGASREDYVRACSDKLGRIRDRRAQQMNQGGTGVMQGMQMPMQQNMQMPNQNFAQMQQMQNMNPNMGIPPHLLQQQMQGSPMMNQQQQPVKPAQMNQPQPGMQMNMQANNQQKQGQVAELTADDNKAINLRAAELAKSTPKEEMRSIVEKMNPQLRQSLSQKAVDPIIYYFRMLATKEFRRAKQLETGIAPGQMNNNGNMINQQQGQPKQMNQVINGGGNMMGDMGRFQGQQAEGLRSQGEGELVVPASNAQGMIPEQMRLQQQMMANQQRAGQQGQGNINPAFIAQQQRLQAAQATKMQQAQLQAQNQAQAQAQARAQAAAAQAQMANQRQNMPQSNTPLSAINRPVGPNVSGSSPAQPVSRPASGTPMMNQQQMQMNNGMQQQGQQQQMEQHKREQALANFPAPLQAILRQKPQSEWKNILTQFQNSGNMRRSLSQQPQGMQNQQQQQQQQPSQVQQMQNGAFLSGGNVGGAQMMQSLSQGAMSQPGDMNAMQSQMQQNQEMMRQRQMAMQQQKQQQQQPQSQGQQQGPRQQLNSQQMKVMDQQPVPPAVFNNIRQHAAVPEMRTWYQLKQWLIQNPVPNWPVSHVLDIQASHFAHIMRTRSQQQQQQQQQQNNGMPQAQQMQQVQQMQQGQVQGTPTQPPMGSGLPRFPNHIDLQKVRAANPQLANRSDEQIRALIMQRQRQQQGQKQVAQQGGAQGMSQPMQLSTSQQGQQFPMQPPQNQQTQAQARPPSGQAGSQPRPSPSQTDNKAIKRPSDDDVVEIQNQTFGKPPQLQTENKFPHLSKEQYNQLDPAKKHQYLNLQREQQLRKRLYEIMKEVQSSMPKLRPIPNMDPASKERLTRMLTSDNVKNMVGRFDAFLVACYRMDQNEATLKQLTAQKIQLMSQYKPDAYQRKSFEVVDNFSITPETAEAIINNIMAKFQQTVATIPQNKARAQPAQLTPENLNLLQAQEAERKKALKANQAPPAPTSSQPPFQIGDKGQGAPAWYGTPGLKQEDLKLPAEPKRRKKNQPQATGSTPPIVTSPQQMKTPKATQIFRCPVQGCEHQVKGFATQAELDQHHNVTHRLDMEPVTDPLAFLKDSLRSALNLDENMKQIKKPKAESKTATIKGESAAGNSAAKTSLSETDDDPWKHTNITLDQMRIAFGGDEWEELFPTQEKIQESEAKFYEAYRNTSERWRKINEGPNGALTDTSTDKSKSPETSDKELPAVKGKNAEPEKKEEDPWVVSLEGIEGLDLSSLDDMSPFENIGEYDGGGMGGSPFEHVEKPLSAEQQFLKMHGIDMDHPENWSQQQRELAEFAMT